MARLGRGTARAVIYSAMYVELAATQFSGSATLTGTTDAAGTAVIKVPSVFLGSATLTGTTATSATDGARVAVTAGSCTGTTDTSTTDGSLSTAPMGSCVGTTDLAVIPTGLGGSVGIDESVLEIVAPRRLLPVRHVRRRRR